MIVSFHTLLNSLFTKTLLSINSRKSCKRLIEITRYISFRPNFHFILNKHKVKPEPLINLLAYSN